MSELQQIGPSIAEVMRGLAPTQADRDELERRLRRDAVEFVTDAIREYVRDGACNLTVRIEQMPVAEFRALDLEEERTATGLPRKREWLTGSDRRIVVEYVSDPDLA